MQNIWGGEQSGNDFLRKWLEPEMPNKSGPAKRVENPGWPRGRGAPAFLAYMCIISPHWSSHAER